MKEGIESLARVDRNRIIIDEVILLCSAQEFRTVYQIEEDLKKQSVKYQDGFDGRLRPTIDYFLQNGFLFEFDPAYQGNNQKGHERYLLTAKGVVYKKELFESLMKLLEEMAPK